MEMIINFESLKEYEWLGCGFSTRFGGVSKGCFSTMNMSFMRGDDPEDVRENIRIFSEAAGFKPEDIVMPHQCHTSNVEIVGRNECGRGVIMPGTDREVDGQITNEKHVVLYVLGADCVPVFLADIKNRVISAVHAGWRGTIADITGNAIEMMKSVYGSEPKDIKTVIGPSICQDCYEVSGDVVELFAAKYTISDFSIVRPASGKTTVDPDGKYFLNLWEANRVNLIRKGISPQNIEISGSCTKCHPERFFSHRAHGNDRGVNIGYIYLK